MSDTGDINELILFAMAGSMWISQDTRQEMERCYPSLLITQFDRIRAACDEPIEAWTMSTSSTEAARKVEPRLRRKYPELSDESIRLLLSHAAFSWR